MEVKAQHCFTGRSELKEKLLYKGCLLYVLHQCICSGYSMSLQLHSLIACVHLLSVAVSLLE